VPADLNDADGNADFKNATGAAVGVCCDSLLKGDNCNAVPVVAGETAGETKTGETAGETKKGETKKGETKKKEEKKEDKKAGES